METQLLENYLRKTYYDVGNPAGFTSVDNLYRQARKDGKKVTRKQVKEFLKTVRAYTIHKPAPTKFGRRKVITGGIGYLWQLDLTDLQSLEKFNGGFRYLFFCIDCFSRYLWVVPLKDKREVTTIKAFDDILSVAKRQPIYCEFDRGTEFGFKFKRSLERKRITWYHPYNKILKAEIVERSQRTIKQRMFKYFTYNRSWRYIDVLPNLIDAYNHSYHRTIKMAPADVTQANQAALWKQMYGDYVGSIGKKSDISVGDYVRIKLNKGVFDKGYAPAYSEALYKVTEVMTTLPITYKLEDWDGEPLDQKFYANELALTQKQDELFYIEKILGKRKVGRKNQLLVKWMGYGPKFNSWVWESDVLYKYRA